MREQSAKRMADEDGFFGQSADVLHVMCCQLFEGEGGQSAIGMAAAQDGGSGVFVGPWGNVGGVTFVFEKCFPVVPAVVAYVGSCEEYDCFGLNGCHMCC